MPDSVESYLRTASWVRTVTRGESRRDVQIVDLVLVELENEGPKPGESVPYIRLPRRREGAATASELRYSVCMGHEDVPGRGNPLQGKNPQRPQAQCPARLAQRSSRGPDSML
ncbi:hypothetical protein V8E54_004663 [Elaphomyces granulatus]